MPVAVNLAHRMEKQLPLQLLEFMESAGLIAADLGWRLYLVGGTVRDLLLERPSFDLDMVVEGDAIALGKLIAEARGAKITAHPRFGTVKLTWQSWTIDIASARTETYVHPGALPQPEPGNLAEDLFRRDFTINAMAAELFSGRWGQLVDLFGGREDLKQKKIRILHDNSFKDDATRIWRAIRYEQRLDFSIEPGTMDFLRQDTSFLQTISGTRLRHELELVLKEAEPEKALCRASELGVLAKLDPELKGDERLAKWFQSARELVSPEVPSVNLYLPLLCYRLPAKNLQRLTSFFGLSKQASKILYDSALLQAQIHLLDNARLARSRIYELLNGYAAEAIEANLIAADSPAIRKNINLFLDKLRYVKPLTGGGELIKLGITAVPKIKKVLHRLLEAKLDGKVQTKKDEIELAKRLQ